MKKNRVISLVMLLAVMISLMNQTAWASVSDIVDNMEVDANAALLMDLDSGYVMYEQDADKVLYPASTTKIMTALLVLEAVDAGKLSLDEKITAPSTTWDGISWDSSNQNIQIGEQISVRDLLYCLMVASACEAANVLAVAVSGSVEAFVGEMNSRAAELGCTNTHFVNAHGLHDDNHYTTARDMAIIAAKAMENSTFRTIVATADYTVEATNMSDSRHFYSTNGLLSNYRVSGYYYSYAIGIKTGSTSEAGYCLVSAAEKDGQTLLCVVMGAELEYDDNGAIVDRNQFSESIRLFEWGFENFSYQTILDTSNPVREVEVTMSSETDYVAVVADGTLEAQLPNDVTADMFRWVIDLPESVEAPVEEGDVLGTLTLMLDDEEYGTVNLVALNSVERSEFLATKERVISILSDTRTQVLIIAAVVLLLILIILLTALHRRKKRRRRSGASRPVQNYRGGRRRR